MDGWAGDSRRQRWVGQKQGEREEKVILCMLRMQKPMAPCTPCDDPLPT